MVDTEAGNFAKPEKAYAQELAQIIGMIQQRNEGGSAPPKHRMIPLISATQHYASLVLATYKPEYYNFLDSGEEEEDVSLLEVNEYGMYNLRRWDDLKRFSAVVVTLVEHFQEAGPIP